MREEGRINLGYFPTPPRVTEKIANMLTSKSKKLNVIDAGCGEGEALIDATKNLSGSVTLRGIEADEARAAKADAAVKEIGQNNRVVWSGIEDVSIRGANLVWFNPPYDNVRGMGRYETILLEYVRTWMAEKALIIAIVPDYVVTKDRAFANLYMSRFNHLGHWRFPDPEYKKFQQCVLIGRTRSYAVHPRRLDTTFYGEWPILGEGNDSTIDIYGSDEKFSLKLKRVGRAHMDYVERESSLDFKAISLDYHNQKLERPILPLTEGHTALALAGGHCDGELETVVDGQKVKFLVKGTTSRFMAKTKTEEQEIKDSKGRSGVKFTDYYRNQYKMDVHVLTDQGTLEVYSSHEEGNSDDNNSGEDKK